MSKRQTAKEYLAVAKQILSLSPRDTSQGYDEGLCRECREPSFGLAYDVEGLCDVCGDGHEWGDK